MIETALGLTCWNNKVGYSSQTLGNISLKMDDVKRIQWSIFQSNSPLPRAIIEGNLVMFHKITKD